jgi:hypothetical protein
MSVEGWKSLFDVAAVILLFFTFAAGAGALWTGRIINREQEKKLRDFDSELTGAKVFLAIQQERAAKADGRVAGLELDVAGAKVALAEQQERAANAERSLLELHESIAWRMPDQALISKLAPPLQPFAGQRFGFVVDPGDPERSGVLSWIVILLGTAKWKLEPTPASRVSELDFQATNIVVWVSPNAPHKVLEAARLLVPALERAGLPAVVLQSGWGPKPEPVPPEFIRVVIYKKGPRMTIKGNSISFEESPTTYLFGEGAPG